jgi:hypothetical protein
MEDRNNARAGHRGTASHRPAPAAPVTVKPTPPAAPTKPTGRHAAIRNAVPSLATYKSWSAKARTDWEQKK